MCKGGGSKRGFLHTLSLSLVRDPKDIPTFSCTSPLTIAKTSSPSWRAPLLSSVALALLLYASSSSDVTTSLTSQGDLIFSYSTLLPLLLVSSPHTLLLMPTLFDNLSSSVLLFNTKVSSAHPFDATFFIFILGMTPCLHPLLSFLHSYTQLSSLSQLFLRISLFFSPLLFWVHPLLTSFHLFLDALCQIHSLSLPPLLSIPPSVPA
jgi:hypothetical protein